MYKIEYIPQNTAYSMSSWGQLPPIETVPEEVDATDIEANPSFVTLLKDKRVVKLIQSHLVKSVTKV